MGYDISEVAVAGARKLTQLDYVANNLANVSTTGFKAEHLYYALKGKQAQEGARADLGNTATTIDFSQGTVVATGNPLDVAIEGNGFFVVQKNDGTAYTRNGGFVTNKNKELVTKNGEKIMGESGTITINGSQIKIDPDGSVNVDGNLVGKLKVVSFTNLDQLSRGSEGQFIDDGSAIQTKATDYRVSGGSLETSNVNAMKEMVDMIEGQRSFESYQKIITTMADLDKISTSRIGKLA